MKKIICVLVLLLIFSDISLAQGFSLRAKFDKNYQKDSIKTKQMLPDIKKTDRNIMIDPPKLLDNPDKHSDVLKLTKDKEEYSK